MAKSPEKPKKATAPKKRGPVLFVTLDDGTEQALQTFLAAQPVEPDRAAVGLKALRQFLAAQGYWPPPRKPAP